MGTLCMQGGDSTVRESTTTLAISCLPTDVSASVLQTLIRNAVKPVADVRGKNTVHTEALR